MSLTLALLLLGVVIQLLQAAQTVAIQKTKQTFYSYIPLAEGCNYNSSEGISSGEVYYQTVDPLSIFQSIQLAGNLAFWGAIQYGLDMYLLTEQLLNNGTYSQVVLFNSSVDLRFTERQLALADISLQGQITMYFATPQYHQPNQLNAQIVSSWTSSFSLPVRQKLVDCGNRTFIIYLGNNLYLGACPNTTTLIVWNISNSQAKVYSGISYLNGSTIQGVTPNPDNLLPIPDINNPEYWKIGGYSYDWNAAILLDQESTTIFCMFNLSMVSCDGYENEALWLQIVANRAWGLQAVIQQTQIEMVISEFPQIVNLTFPGNVISVFTNGLTIFVESAANNQIYLLIYESNQQLANITLPGLIIYYGQERLVLQTANGTFLIANFVLPMLSIVNNNTQNSANVSIECAATTYNFNFDIFWTNINYPSSLVIQLNQQQIVSNQKVATFDLSSMYQVIGPAFDVFISSASPLQITLLDTSFVVITDSIAALLDIIYVQSTIKYSIPYYLLYITHIGQIKKYILKNGKTQSVISNPCGFQQVSTAKKVYGGFLILQDSQSCLCTSNFNTCQTLTLSDTVSIISSGSVTLAAYLQKMAQIQSETSQVFPDSPFNKTSIIKSQFLNLLAQNIIVTIYTNNTVVLTTIEGVYLDSVQSSCTVQNTTLGLAFTRNFYDDYFFVYCEFSSTIDQYYIRKQQLIYNKAIPLYGFLTLGSDGNAAAGTDYIFIEVKINPEYTGTDAFAKEVESCCILRIDPMAFTVSAIAEVILADQLVFVQSILGVDVVYYNQTNIFSEQTYLKVYYDSSWISFSQPGPCSGSQCTPITYNYQIAFNSLLYNFAACYQSTIEYNIQASLLRTNDPQLEDIQLLQGSGPNIYYSAAVNFNFNTICGPIAYFGQTSTLLTDLSIFSICTNQIITSNKFLGNSSSPLLQIIDMGEILAETALADLIMIVNEQSLSFYTKYSNIWLQFVEEIANIPQPDCMYYLYEIVNNNTAKFGTDCFNADIFTPLLTVTYDQAFNDSLNCTFEKMQLPQQLRNVQSVIQPNLSLPLLFGIGEGPSKSVSGILFYCYEVCTTLVISTKVVFFVDFDVIAISEGGFIVVGLDLQKFSFWISPSIPNDTSSSIPANFTVNYSQILGLSCNKIVIVAGSLTSVNVVMACRASYVQTEVYMESGIIEIMNTFNKYANCEQINKFKPTFWISPETKKLEVLVTQCQQNLATVRLQQFESINNSQSSIVTAYMQIYTSSGPKCGQQWWPIRILPIATSMNFMLFQLYYANNHLKLLYEQIDGTLIDAFIEPTPSSSYELIELSRHLVFPTVQLRIGNAYSELIFMIETNPVKAESPAGIRYALIIAFSVTNFITLVFLICWIVFARKYRRSNNNKSTYHLKKMIEAGNESPRSFKPSSLSASQSASQSESSASSVRHPSNIRKVTEIQLFQPRYKA